MEVWDATLVPATGRIGWLEALAGQVRGVLGPVIAAVLALHIAAAAKHKRANALRRPVLRPLKGN